MAPRREAQARGFLVFLFPIVGALFIWAAPDRALGLGPAVEFTLPAENAMPSPFGSVPFPSDLYFDQGEKGDGDGTLLNSGADIGITAIAFNTNFTPAVERGLDTMDGWGVTSGCFFFFSAPIDSSSLPVSPVTTPTTSDSLFLMNLSDGGLVPIKLVADVDTRVPNTLSVVPIPGNVLKPNTTYACVVTSGVQGGGQPVVPTADFVAARDKTSANTDANDIYGSAADTVVANAAGLARANIVGMAVFTTQSPNADLAGIQTTVLPGLPMPTADFSFADHDLVFETPAELDAALGPNTPHSNIAIVATGYFESPRFQTDDGNGNGPIEDLPNLSDLSKPCTFACEPDDERFVDTSPPDGLPDIQRTPKIPFTVVIPNSPAPGAGYPIIIDQHGLGGDRKIVVDLGDALAAEGFASIGIDAVAHGYRYKDPNGVQTTNSADLANNFGGTTVPDGFGDAGLFGVALGTLSTQLGFFQGFVNLVGVRDNFRQTCADLMQLVRLIQSNTIDSGLGVDIDENNIFYLGHSLGAIMGSCLAAFEPDIQAYALNAPGGGLVGELLLNSSIGAGALASLQVIYGLDPANVMDDFSIFSNVVQGMIDAGDPLTKAPHWLGDPLVGGPRNIMQIVDHQDEVVPNQSGEALAHAAGLELFRPYVTNPMISPVAFPLAAGSGSISGNGPAGVTAFLLQQGTAAHAATMVASVSSLSLVPEHALVAEWGTDGSTAFPSLERPVRIENESVLSAVLGWFGDIVASGPPGTFSFSPTQNQNPRENQALAGGPETLTFMARDVDGVAAAEPNPDVVVSFNSNSDPGRLTVARSILGTRPTAGSGDMPPDVPLLSSGVLPFFVTLQKEPAGVFNADVTVAYTIDELADAGIVDGSAEEAALELVKVGGPGTCAVGGGACTDSGDCGENDPCIEILPTIVDTGANTLQATGLTSFSTLAAMNLSLYTPAPQIPGGGSVKTDCAAEWLLAGRSFVLDRKGFPARKQSCNQGDPTCDFDTDPTRCTFRVGLCFNVDDDRVPLCDLKSGPTDTSFTYDGVFKYEVKKPSEKDAVNPKKPGAAENRAALLAVVENVLRLPQTLNNCAAFEIAVPLKSGTKKGKAVLKIRATDSSGKVRDSDTLKVTCEP